MQPLPHSQKKVLEILGTCGALTHKEIAEKMTYSPRTVRYALQQLKEKKLLIRKMNLQDMRQVIYQNRVNSLQEAVGTDR
ncbi:MarR family transcriptional regulator [Methanoregula sp.]|uniref:MarR family transcriptional regulator n=1 Tax=Methanoregula sp. TaxID=2052170 RepID=UPI002CB63F71|nr:MarR family transcriptional regulator [Methanoregula sp.]HVP96099.1 MarR family transcriptional regulator [Methanoregula sp.]